MSLHSWLVSVSWRPTIDFSILSEICVLMSALSLRSVMRPTRRRCIQKGAIFLWTGWGTRTDSFLSRLSAYKTSTLLSSDSSLRTDLGRMRSTQ